MSLEPAKTIVVASHNPVKAQATLRGFQRVFPHERFRLERVEVASGVSRQPRSDRATLQGARNRADGAVVYQPEADFWVGIEGGIEEREEGMTAFAWVVVMSRQRVGQGRTGTFFLPEKVARLVRQGLELGEADDLVFDRTDSKRQEGAIGLLTGNLIDRTSLYEHAVVLALVPLRNLDLYREESEHGFSLGSESQAG
jgi:inosine/xanthosine triphosphatase